MKVRSMSLQRKYLDLFKDLLQSTLDYIPTPGPSTVRTWGSVGQHRGPYLRWVTT